MNEDLPEAPEKVISLPQPWAWAVASGVMPLLNRSWKTDYRGPVAVHASPVWSESGQYEPLLRRAWKELVQDVEHRHPKEGGPLREGHPLLPTGVILAVAELTGVCSQVAGMSPGDVPECGCGSWAAYGVNHLLLEGVRALEWPVTARGSSGLGPVKDRALEDLRWALKRMERQPAA